MADRPRMSGLWSAACGVAAVVVTGCGPDLYLMEKNESRVGDEWFYLGGGCMAVDTAGGGSTGGGTAGGANQDYSTVLTLEDGRGEFTVTVDGEVIEHRVFDETFLRSRRLEVVTVELPDGEANRYSFWGGPECESPDEPDTEAYEEAQRAAEQEEG